jgi:hypothetical protein
MRSEGQYTNLVEFPQHPTALGWLEELFSALPVSGIEPSARDEEQIVDLLFDSASRNGRLRCLLSAPSLSSSSSWVWTEVGKLIRIRLRNFNCHHCVYMARLRCSLSWTLNTFDPNQYSASIGKLQVQCDVDTTCHERIRPKADWRLE